MYGKRVNQALDALSVFNYAPTTMSKIRLWTEAGVFLFAFLVMVPSIAAAIGYAAWNGKPRNYSRELFFTAFVLVGGISGALLTYAIRMRADIRTWNTFCRSPALESVHCFWEWPVAA